MTNSNTFDTLRTELKAARKQNRMPDALVAAEAIMAQFPDKAASFSLASDIFFDLGMKERGLTALAKAALIEGPSGEASVTLAKRVAKRFGVEIRDSIGEILGFVRHLGFKPNTVIDIGVDIGTQGLLEFFPQANILMVEPVAESIPFMERICELYPNAAFESCAVASEPGEMQLSVDPAFSSSQLVSVATHSKGATRTVPVRTLDEIVARRGLTGPYMIKVDTEGAEIEVLRGAKNLLADTELMILETRLRPRGQAPDFLELTDFLRPLGFMPYDFIARNYHRGDRTLKQFDAIFVKKDGFFRTSNEYRSFVPHSEELRDATSRAKQGKREKAAKRLGIDA